MPLSRRPLLGALAALPLAASPGSRARAAEPVDLLLVLAVDASGSIDADEFALQRQGYAEAITDARVLAGITGGPIGAVAVAMVEWGAPRGAATVVPWRRIADAASAGAAAAAILAAPRSLQSFNAIGDALVHATALLAAAPFEATRQVIDVSGDGPDMRSVVPAPVARDAAVAGGITVNALLVLAEGGRMVLRGESLAAHYRAAVIGGPGAFVETAAGRGDFARAIRAKLVREIAADPTASPAPG